MPRISKEAAEKRAIALAFAKNGVAIALDNIRSAIDVLQEAGLKADASKLYAYGVKLGRWQQK